MAGTPALVLTLSSAHRPPTQDPSCSLLAGVPTAVGSHLQGSFAVSSHLHINLAAQGKLAGTEKGKDVRRAQKATLFVVPTYLLPKPSPPLPASCLYSVYAFACTAPAGLLKPCWAGSARAALRGGT